MRKQPSPVIWITVLSGLPSLAPMAAPRPKPMVPKPPEVMQLAGVVKVEMLDGPHLMLAHVGGRRWRRRGRAVAMVSRICLGVRWLPGSRHRPSPWGRRTHTPSTRCGHTGGSFSFSSCQHPLGVADDVVVGLHVLVDLRPVNVDLHNLGLAGKGLPGPGPHGRRSGSPRR